MLRLLKVLEGSKVFRMYSESHKKEDIHRSIVPFPNWHEGRCQVPALEFVYQARVVICTAQTAGYFMRSIKDPLFDANHFDYLILDEAACLEQTAALVPVIGVWSNPDSITTKIVLCGDPQQLGPVLKSRRAIELGFGVSLMERLMEMPCYRRDPATGKYNSKFIVQLTKTI